MTSANDAHTSTHRAHFSRRQILGGAAGAAGTIFAAGSASVAGTLIARSATAQEGTGVTPRAITAGRVYGSLIETLVLEGQPAGPLLGTSGGLPFAEVTPFRTNEGTTTKVVSAVRVEPLKIECGIGMSAEWYKWIADTISGHKGLVRKSGAVVSYDATGKAISQLVFSNALISEITLPALDASAKELARLGVTLVPESAQLASAGGAPGPTSGPKTQKAWTASNFALSIDGLDTSTSFITNADPMTFKVTLGAAQTGAERHAKLVPTGLETPNLVVRLPEARAAAFYQWFDRFVLKGDAQSRLQGTLSYMQPTLQGTLGAVHFHNLGIMKYSPEIRERDAIRQVRIEMFCDSITLDLGGFV